LRNNNKPGENVMQRLRSALFGLAAVAVGFASPAAADVKLGDGTMLADAPYYIVSYVEAAPNDTAKVSALLREQADRSKSESGALRMEVLQNTGRPNHFLLLEIWADPAARAAHARAAHTKAFRQALEPHLYSPYDERAHVALDTAAPAGLAAATPSSVFAVTHVDIIPPEQFAPCKRQVDENGPCGNALVLKLAGDSRKHAGAARFDVLTQANRPNHMTVVEMWDSAGDQEAHTVNPDTMAFRDGLAGVKPGSGVQPDAMFLLNPLSGSLYDEGLYTLAR
jgi:quinol monooxygenase YgiN